MKIEQKKLSELHRPEKNVRMHSSKQLAEFRRSIEMFGQIRPIVVDDGGTILAGNGLYDALLSMNRMEADCYVVHNLTENEKKKLMLADNRVFSLGVDDLSAFDAIIAELGNDLDIPGYDPNLLQSLVADVDDVDEMISGYGIISEDDKASMNKAAARYEVEEKSFSANAVEISPANTEQAKAKPQECVTVIGETVTHSAIQKPQETSPEPLQRKFVVCPKCGEKIWL